MEQTGRFKKYEKKIMEQEKEILELENKIEEREKEILETEGKVFKKIGGFNFLTRGISRFEAQFLRMGFVRRFGKHKILYTLTTVAAIVLIWRGIWMIADRTPGVANPFISIFLGLFILWFTDRFSNLIK